VKQHFRMFAAYNSWANAQLYDAVDELSDDEFNRDTGAFFRSMAGTLNHILVADRIWMKRFTGEGQAPATLDTILFSEFGKLRAAREAEDRRIADYVEGLTEKAFAGRFTYMTVTDMRTVSQRLAPALAHLFNHQTHHRGQAHTILTSLGKPSLTLDLIYFQRTENGRQFA
jgi:uncharacterized damage-inducible protein DinB